MCMCVCEGEGLPRVKYKEQSLRHDEDLLD